VLNKLLIILIILLIPISYALFKKESQKDAGEVQSPSKLRVCPDSWIENRMPSVSNTHNEKKQYFIVNGERREIDDYDLDWIKENCNIKPQIVY